MKLDFLNLFVGYGLMFLVDGISCAKVIEYKVKRTSQEIAEIPSRHLTRRTASTYLETLANNITQDSYYATIQVGTPPQSVDLIFALASSDIWVIDSSASACATPGSCYTPFDANASQTFTLVSPDFNITYDSGEPNYVAGVYFKDHFAIGQPDDEAQAFIQMGLALESTSGFFPYGGVLGLGYPGAEASYHTYPTLMEQLVDVGLTNSMLYSLYLDDIHDSSGSILFGGIDTEKYYGTLYSMPVNQDANGNYTYFNVTLASISFSSNGGSTTQSLTNQTFSENFFFGSDIMYLPHEIVNQIYDDLNVKVIDTTPYIDCKYGNASYLSFGFPIGSIVNITFSNLVLSIPSTDTVPTGLPFNNACYLDILSNELADGTNYFGQGFLRQAYSVFDLTNHRVGIAQSVLNTSLSNVVEVQAGAASIPQIMGVPIPIQSPSPTPHPISNSTTTSHSTSKNHGVAIGVGVAVPVVAILAGLLAFFFWRRRRHTSSADDAPPVLVDDKHAKVVHISELPESSIAGSPETAQGRFEGGSLSPNRSSLPVYTPYQGENRPLSPALSDPQGYEGYEASGSPHSPVVSATIFNGPH